MKLAPETVSDIKFFAAVIGMIALAELSTFVYFGVIKVVLVVSR